MSGIIFLVALGAIASLAVWTVMDPDQASRYWWPFDMKPNSKEQEDESPPVKVTRRVPAPRLPPAGLRRPAAGLPAAAAPRWRKN